jgi:hypothetical protein
MMNLKGKAYLPVAPRIVAFREEHPDWSIQTEPVEFRDTALCRAIILDADRRIIATAFKTVTAFQGGSFEKAETGAIGRALSLCGYGTLAAQDMDEGEDIADSPAPPKRQAPPAAPAKPAPAPAAKPAAKAPTFSPPSAPPPASPADPGEDDPSVDGPAASQVKDMLLAIGNCQTEAELSKIGTQIKALSPAQQQLLRGPYTEALGFLRTAMAATA